MTKEKKYKVCQSCGMPLKKDQNKEHDYYCSYCWKDGDFTKLDMTIEEMKEINFKVMTEEMKLPKWIANGFNKKLHKLERWKDKE